MAEQALQSVVEATIFATCRILDGENRLAQAIEDRHQHSEATASSSKMEQAGLRNMKETGCWFDLRSVVEDRIYLAMLPVFASALDY